MKEIGAPSNNMLLSSIHGESKRIADEVMKLGGKVERLERGLADISDLLERLCELTAAQNAVVSSTYINSPGDIQSPRIHGKSSPLVSDTKYFYQGSALSGKYTMCACVIAQLINIVKLHLENENIRYPDSVDCPFSVLVKCFQESAKVRCTIPSVVYKNEISVPEKGSPAFDVILPLVASKDGRSPTTLPESRLSELSTPMTREIIQCIEWSFQRLQHLECILSPQQIDIIKSIRFPLLRPGTEDELNWDPSVIKARKSHTIAHDVGNLSPSGKTVFIQQMMKNQGLMQSWVTAQERNTKK
jgi:hypothetical protein